jgi:hypothetical protein
MAYIGVSPSNGVRRKHTYTATASQTSFSGAGAEGATLSYSDSNFVDVYQNGVKLADEDYTATSGTAIVLAQGASADDIVEIIAFDVFSVADTVSKADGGTFDGNVTMAGTLGVTGVLTGTSLDISGDIDVDGTTNLDVVDIDGAVDMASGLTVAGNIVINSGIVRGERGTEAAPPFTFSDDLDTGMFNISNADLGFTVGGTERARIHANGVVSASAGVALGVGTANTASNVLDDYEEGTWTPTIYGTTTAGTTTYFQQAGTYTKVGRLVTVQIFLNITGQTGAGSVRLGGLPFTAGAGANTFPFFPKVGDLAMSTDYYPIFSVAGNDTFCYMEQAPTGGGTIHAIPLDTSFTCDAVVTYWTA